MKKIDKKFRIILDSDHTLYDTDALTDTMLNCLASEIIEAGYTSKKLDEIKGDLKAHFTRPEKSSIPDCHYDIYELIDTYCKTTWPNLDTQKAKHSIDDILANGDQFLYPDVKPFLRFLNENGYHSNIYILSYNPYGSENNSDFGTKKVQGTGLGQGLINPSHILSTHKQKATHDIIESANSLFICIDDNPPELKSFYMKKLSELANFLPGNLNISLTENNLNKLNNSNARHNFLSLCKEIYASIDKKNIHSSPLPLGIFRMRRNNDKYSDKKNDPEFPILEFDSFESLQTHFIDLMDEEVEFYEKIFEFCQNYPISQNDLELSEDEFKKKLQWIASPTVYTDHYLTEH